MPDERVCPECGRASTAKLCPGCGYPLMFDTPEPAAPVPAEFLRKPVTERAVEPDRGGRIYQGVEPIRSRETLGPHCPGCHHRNAARRVRCERCGAELWPGAASPPRRQSMLPPVTAPPRQRPIWPWVVLAVVVGLALVYAVAYTLA